MIKLLFFTFFNKIDLNFELHNSMLTDLNKYEFYNSDFTYR